MKYCKKESIKMNASKLIIAILLIPFVLPVTAQNEVDDILKSIEANSTTLEALRKQAEAQKLGNRTGLYPENPEVEFNYLWGNSAAGNNRTDVRATQSFDFPTAYAHRNRISRLENANADLMYKSERINLLLRAKQVCIELAYYNALAEEYTVRLANARRIAGTYQAQFDSGDVNILENNKARLNLTTVDSEMDRIEIERASLLSELKALNGGADVSFTALEIVNEPLPADFDEWYAAAESKSPMLQYVRGQIEIGERQVKLNAALGLPKFTAGYMSEKAGSERLQGITVGVSVPLWENRNRMKQAKAQVRAAETALEDTKTQFCNQLRNLFTKASGLQKNTLKYRDSLTAHNNEALLKKALDGGEISLLNYLLEIEYYYEAMNKALEAERDLSLALAELGAVEL